MTNSFEKLFDAYKDLSDEEKIDAIIDYLRYDIDSLNTINHDINNSDAGDIKDIMSEEADNKYDLIYQLLLVLNEQIESFTKKIANDFFEDA